MLTDGITELKACGLSAPDIFKKLLCRLAHLLDSSKFINSKR